LRDGASLGVRDDAREGSGQWQPMATTNAGADVVITGVHGDVDIARFVTFEPLQISGVTRGVRLNGYMGPLSVLFTTVMSQCGTWCHHRIEVSGSERIFCRSLTHSWNLTGFPERVTDISWPPAPIYGFALAGNPAAFQQRESLLVALVADLDEGEPGLLQLQSHLRDEPRLEFGVATAEQHPLVLATPVRFAYTTCFDAHAQPEYGFQQVVRLLGNHDALTFATTSADVLPRPGALPALPVLTDMEYQQPLLSEESPAAMVALVRHQLTLADLGDWYALEEGVRWLDRLCLEQHIYDVPGGSPFGAYGDGPAWRDASLWLPCLLFDAFRLTGSAEYAQRGIAALSALATEELALVLGHLRPRYGDLYVHADFARVLPFVGVEVNDTYISGNEIALELAPLIPGHTPLLVIEGSEPTYTVMINGCTLGEQTAANLRAGIPLALTMA